MPWSVQHLVDAPKLANQKLDLAALVSAEVVLGTFAARTWNRTKGRSGTGAIRGQAGPSPTMVSRMRASGTSRRTKRRHCRANTPNLSGYRSALSYLHSGRQAPTCAGLVEVAMGAARRAPASPPSADRGAAEDLVADRSGDQMAKRRPLGARLKLGREARTGPGEYRSWNCLASQPRFIPMRALLSVCSPSS